MARAVCRNAVTLTLGSFAVTVASFCLTMLGMKTVLTGMKQIGVQLRERVSQRSGHNSHRGQMESLRAAEAAGSASVGWGASCERVG